MGDAAKKVVAAAKGVAVAAKAPGTDMSILIDANTRVITQGITGKTGQFHTRMSPRVRERAATASSPA